MATEGIPSQVEEAAELAEQLFKQMQEQPTEEKPEINLKEDTSDEEIEDDEEVDGEEEFEEEEDKVVEPDIDPKELKKWRDRYLTLQGKYNAEVPRLASQLKELQEQLINASIKKEPVVEESVEETEDDFEAVYGTDFVENVRKLVNQVIQKEIKPVNEKVERVETTQHNDAVESFKSYLDDNAEGWRDLWEGKDKGFIKFLEQPDPSGLYTNGELLNMYNERWDADKMVKLFNLYKGESSPKQPQRKESLSKEQQAMIAPSRSKVNNEPVSKDKRIWTQDSIKEFEQKDRLGKYSDEESQSMWADLLAAANEGRIR